MTSTRTRIITVGALLAVLATGGYALRAIDTAATANQLADAAAAFDTRVLAGETITIDGSSDSPLGGLVRSVGWHNPHDGSQHAVIAYGTNGTLLVWSCAPTSNPDTTTGIVTSDTCYNIQYESTDGTADTQWRSVPGTLLFDADSSAATSLAMIETTGPTGDIITASLANPSYTTSGDGTPDSPYVTTGLAGDGTATSVFTPTSWTQTYSGITGQGSQTVTITDTMRTPAVIPAGDVNASDAPTATVPMTRDDFIAQYVTPFGVTVPPAPERP